MTEQHCGFVAIIGRPNVGKSTLLNYILGQKVSITSRKPQTTRHRVLGIHTEGENQIIYVDTPGLHRDEKRAINRYMNRAASSSLKDVDLIIFIVEQMVWTTDDELVLERLQNTSVPVILFINKVDKIENKESMLPYINELKEKYSFAEIVPGSALKNVNIEQLQSSILHYIPKGGHFFPEDYITDRSGRFMAAELVREKLVRALGDEIPYSTTVEIESFEADEKIIHIHALILVERKGQKNIVIGKKGSKLKQIGSAARKDMERLFGQKVHLQIWVKVKDGWSDDERALRSLGYDDF